MPYSKIASRGEELQQTPLEKFGELFAKGKEKFDTMQAKLSSILPSMPGMPVGKFYDVSVGVDAHSTVWPPSPLMPVPHIGIVFDIMNAIFAAVNSFVPPAPEPPPVAEGEEPAPAPVTVGSVARLIVDMMKPSVKVHNQWISNAGTTIQHLPGIFFHALPTVTPSASSEMFMGSSKVMADGTPFSTKMHPALSCNIVGVPAPFRKGKTKAMKSLMAPTAMLTTIIPGGNKVLAGGPPTIDLFALMIKLGLKGLGKCWKKIGDKFQKFIDDLPPNSKWKKVLQNVKCKTFGEPVDAVTGRVIAENQDFYLPGPIPIDWTRTYYSDVEERTPLGYNWHFSYDIGYYLLEDDFISLKLRDGREVIVPTLVKGDRFYLKSEKLWWFRDENGYGFKGEDGFVYCFISQEFKGIHPLKMIKDEYGHQVEFFYNHRGLNYIIDSCKRKIIIGQNEQGYIQNVGIEKPEGLYNLVSYIHDESGNITEIVNENGKARKRFYYDGHLLKRLTNQSGMNFYWEYEGKGNDARCVHTWGDEGILEYWTRYEPGKTISTNSLGHTTEYYYHPDRLIHTIIDAKQGVTRQIYNESGELEVLISPEGRVRKFEYDLNANLVNLIDENENATRFHYDRENRLIKYDSPNGVSLEWEYNEKGQLSNRYFPDGSYVAYEYDEKGTLTGIVDSKGRCTQLEWDSQHNLTRAVFPNGNQMQWVYDFMGNLLKEILPNQSRVIYKYDTAGNLAELIEADGNHHYFSYNAAGDIIKAKDNNQEVEFEYWGLGLLKSRTQNGKKIVFSYDTEEQLKSIRNEIGEAYRFTRNPLGQIVGEWGFDGLQRQYLRNADGWVTRVLRPENRNTQYQYDGVGNIIVAEHSDGNRECFTYNPDGLLIEAANENSTVKFQRDSSGRIIKEIQNGYEVQSKYDADGNRTQLTSSLGADIQNRFNSLGILEEINTIEGWQTTIERDSLGLETERTMTGGVVSQIERDSKGRVTRHQIQGKNPEGSKKRYIWGAGDRLMRIINEQSGQHTDFSYDSAGNLLAADYSGITKIYKMPDAIGNLFKTPERTDRKYAAGGKLLQDENWHYAYDKEGNLRLKSKRKVNKLKSIDTSQKQATSYSSTKGRFWIEDKPKKEKTSHGFWINESDDDTPSYDNEFDRKAEIRRYSQAELAEYDRLKKEQTFTPDNEIEWLPGDWEYQWQGNGMLQAVRNPKGEWIRFEYDALGRRTAKIVGNTTIFRYIWEGNVLLHEWNYPLKDRPQLEVTPKGQLQYSREEPTEDVTTWVYEEGSFTPSAKLRNGKKYSIVSDYLGTPYQAYNEQGQLIWEVELDIYGKVKEDKFGNGMSIPFRYQGQYEDEETGLYYNRFRYYDCNAGNYISQDPIKLLGGLKFYSYVTSVTNKVDIFGLTWSKNEVLGRTVYQNDDLFDINTSSSWKDPVTGQWKRGTNLERMSDGLAPIGIDGKSVQLHHLTQTEVNGFNGQRGSLAEITTSMHQQYSSQLHMPAPPKNPNIPRQTVPRYPSFRKNNDGTLSDLASEFDEYRGDYWRERANQIRNNHH